MFLAAQACIHSLPRALGDGGMKIWGDRYEIFLQRDKK
jgi:hypothetical protein